MRQQARNAAARGALAVLVALEGLNIETAWPENALERLFRMNTNERGDHRADRRAVNDAREQLRFEKRAHNAEMINAERSAAAQNERRTAKALLALDKQLVLVLWSKAGGFNSQILKQTVDLVQILKKKARMSAGKGGGSGKSGPLR